MILILRGHIRESFKNNNLLVLIENIYKLYPKLIIYIHTWNTISNNISWRNIQENKNVVNEEIIYNYFKNYRLLIKHIIISDDTNITLHGKMNGKLFNSCMPIVGWKNYWYGKYQITKYLYDNISNKNSHVINCRFDVLQNSYSLTTNNILRFIYSHKNRKFVGNTFIFDKPKKGIDNIYMGSVKTMYIITRIFHYDLDKISSMYQHIQNQEFSVFMFNNFIFKQSIKMSII